VSPGLRYFLDVVGRISGPAQADGTKANEAKAGHRQNAKTRSYPKTCFLSLARRQSGVATTNFLKNEEL